MPETQKRSETPPPDGLSRPDSAFRSPAAQLMLWATTGLCLWMDLASKAWAFANLGADEAKVLVPGLITAHRSLNSGALFGSFSGWVPAFIVASVLALAFVVYVFACSGRRQRFLHLGLAFILAGALGNLYDRTFVQADVLTLKPTADRSGGQLIGLIVSESGANPVIVASYPDKQNRRSIPRDRIQEMNRQGVVRDFIKFAPIGGFDYWPWVFNIADALLVVGVGILLICFWRERRPPAVTESAGPAG